MTFTMIIVQNIGVELTGSHCVYEIQLNMFSVVFFPRVNMFSSNSLKLFDVVSLFIGSL